MSLSVLGIHNIILSSQEWMNPLEESFLRGVDHEKWARERIVTLETRYRRRGTEKKEIMDMMYYCTRLPFSSDPRIHKEEDPWRVALEYLAMDVE